MIKRGKADARRQPWRISLMPVLKYQIGLCVALLALVALGSAFVSLQRMMDDVDDTFASAGAQIQYRVAQSVTLLQALAALPDYHDPARPVTDKVRRIDEISGHFGYMMICYVDADINVHSIDMPPVSLASRDYMQRLFATGQTQVTDSFAAGADGVTLNYTVAVPLFMDGNITGCLFCAIYFDEIVELLGQAAHSGVTDAILIGNEGQVMSSTAGLGYGSSILDTARASVLLDTTVDTLETDLLGKKPGRYWSMGNGDLHYTRYARIKGTQWDLLCTGNFRQAYAAQWPSLAFVLASGTLVCLFALWRIRRHIQAQMKVVDTLAQAVRELETKIYQNDRPDAPDLEEIIQLTSTGLSDGLTGVVTRTVFLNQLQSQLRAIAPDRVAAICFVDLDNLKTLNDAYGHAAGDAALKNVAYTLQEFEKKYDGVVGRYGGDEFVLLLTDLNDEAELRQVLADLAQNLHSHIVKDGRAIPIQCSVGATVWKPGTPPDTLLAQADKALYHAKQHGKGIYRLHHLQDQV